MKTFPNKDEMNFPALEEEILAWWQQHNIFETSMKEREGAPVFTFYEGPPTANGRPGIHHVMARTIKDIFCRYKTMKGFQVMRKAGWDTHGLPVEIEVEKALGLEGRHQVEEFGIEAYNAACKESVLKYKDLWDTLTTRMGYWVDLENPYITFNTKYIETLWWLLKQIHDKGFLYKGYKIQWYSPGSGTVLSSHEVSLGYKETQDESLYVKFPVTGEENTYFLAWTTTPWTLISNTALAVGENIDYVKVAHKVDEEHTEYLILAEKRLGVFKEEVEVLARMKGSDLLGKSYQPLFDYFQNEEGTDKAWKVMSGDFVSTSDGTGIVHLAPAFGAEDYTVGMAHGLPLLNPVLPDGTFDSVATLVAGQWFKDANKPITRHLKDRQLVFRQESFVHNYPFDWRKGTPLMQYPMESWFIKTTAIKDRMVALNSTINWQPERIGTGRFGQWLENNIDWALSRSRYWGTPLPIWQSDKEGSEYYEIIGSIEALREKVGNQLPENDEDVDLHRPFVDKLTWDAPDGGTMRRIPDLIDVWFDSGAMPFAQWHYPFENKELFEKSFPADFIAEGVDQTRGWFYTLHAIASLVMDSVAYKNVISNGLLLDAEGQKMSKSKGNVVDPFKAIEENGADVVRWYLMSGSPPWEDVRFAPDGMQITKRKFFNTIVNSYNFFATYASIDGFTFQNERIAVADRPELDRWIISRLNTLIGEVDGALNEYHPTKATRAIEQFVDELSNWFIRRSRRRFWRSEQDSDKEAAFQTVYECLITIAKLMAPVSPFYAEWLYRALNETSGLDSTSSVHLAQFPEQELDAIDVNLEHRMELARTISSLVLALRNQQDVQINVRQPLGQLMVVTNNYVDETSIQLVKEIILEEVNVKDLALIGTSSELVHKTAKANFKLLGRKLGKKMKLVAQKIAEMDVDSINQYEESGSVELEVEGEVIRLEEHEIEVKSEGVEGWIVGTQEQVTVALDTHLSPALQSEGLARETVNRIQNMRKQADFEVTDRIEVYYEVSQGLEQALAEHGTWVQKETLATKLQAGLTSESLFTESFKINEETATFGIRQITNEN